MNNPNDSHISDAPIDVELDDKSNREIRIKHAKRAVRTANIISLALILVLGGIFLLVGKRPTVSQTENRELAKFPKFSLSSFFSGDFTSNAETFYNDTVPLRSFFKDVTSNIRSHLGFELDGVILYGNVTPSKPDDNFAHLVTDADAVSDSDSESVTVSESIPVSSDKSDSDSESETQSHTETDAPTTETDAPVAPTPEEDGILSGGILVYQNRGIPVYYGSFEMGRNYASYVNSFKSDLGDPVNVYSLVAPTAQSFYMPEKYASQYGSEPDNFANIRQYLSNVTEIDAYSVLLPHKDEPIYARTDHHWQPLGAYYAAMEFAAKANVSFPDINSYEKVVVPGYVGTLYGWSQVAALKNNPEDFIFYRPQNQYTTTYYSPDFVLDHTGPLLIDAYGSSLYCTFMGSDEFIVHVSTDCKNNRTLAVIKDSYGNALIPFFTSSFQDIYVIDMRYFNLNAVNFLKEHGVTDLLFAMNSFSATGSNAKYLELIRTQ